MPPLTQNAANGRTAVSLGWLTRFTERVPPSYSTSDVVTQIVVPETRSQLCRYVDQLSQDICGKPEFFISHRWASSFHHLVNALKRHFGDKDGNNFPPHLHVWLDIFAVNQHPGKAQDDDLSKLQDVILQARQTLLVMDNGGQVLRRVWCLFEIFKTVARKGVQHLLVLAHDVNLMGLKDIFIKINVAEAQATNEVDRQNILEDIRKTIGLDRLNDLIRTALVDSTKLEVTQLRQSPSQDVFLYFSVVNKAAQMLTLAGNYVEAEPLMRETLQLALQAVGERSLGVASSVNNLAEVLRYQGRFSEAEPLQRQALELVEQIMGEEHPLTATYLGNLAELEMALGRSAAAEPLLRRALLISQKVNGPATAKTATLMNSLASLLMDLGKLQDAEKYCRLAVSAIEKELGPEDPDLVVYVTNLAGVLQEREDHAAAQQLLEKALALCTRTLGEQHPMTATVLNNLGESLKRQQRMAEAEPLMRRALQVREAVLGAEHPATANSLNNLGGLYAAQGKLAEAAEAFTLSLRINTALFGPEHPAVANRLVNLAMVRQEQGSWGQAEELLRQALDVRVKSLGEDHADTTASKLSLGNLYFQQHKMEQAIPLLKQVVAAQRALLSRDSPALLTTLTQLAMAQHSLGQDPLGTMTLLREAQSIAAQLNGPGSDEVEQYAQFIASVQDSLACPSPGGAREDRSTPPLGISHLVLPSPKQGIVTKECSSPRISDPHISPASPLLLTSPAGASPHASPQAALHAASPIGSPLSSKALTPTRLAGAGHAGLGGGSGGSSPKPGDDASGRQVYSRSPGRPATSQRRAYSAAGFMSHSASSSSLKSPTHVGGSTSPAGSISPVHSGVKSGIARPASGRFMGSAKLAWAAPGAPASSVALQGSGVISVTATSLSVKPVMLSGPLTTDVPLPQHGTSRGTSPARHRSSVPGTIPSARKLSKAATIAASSTTSSASAAKAGALGARALTKTISTAGGNGSSGYGSMAVRAGASSGTLKTKISGASKEGASGGGTRGVPSSTAASTEPGAGRSSSPPKLARSSSKAGGKSKKPSKLGSRKKRASEGLAAGLQGS